MLTQQLKAAKDNYVEEGAEPTLFLPRHPVALY
jgi:hypothetical protein